MIMKGSLQRKTKETCIEVTLDTDGSGVCKANTGIELLSEILRALAEASGFDIYVKAKGDLETGDHHTTEDIGIALGSVLAKLTTEGFGSAIAPSGECLAMAAVRLGEPGYSANFDFRSQEIGGMQMENFSHFMRSLAYSGKFTLHLRAEGEDDMGKIDAIALALGKALQEAFASSEGPGQKH